VFIFVTMSVVVFTLSSIKLIDSSTTNELKRPAVHYVHTAERIRNRLATSSNEIMTVSYL